MKELSLENQIYLCKYHEIDNCLHLGITAKERDEILTKLKENGLYKQYRMLDEDEYEHIIKKEKNKYKSKYENILDKYKFDKTNKAYNHLKQVLEISDKDNSTEFSLEKIYRKIADKEKIKNYIVNNDCKRILDNTYLSNKEIFEQNQYHKKPSVREFVLKELNIEIFDPAETKKIIEESISNSTKETTKNEKSINSQFIADIDNTYVKVSVKTVAEWAYQKRVFRQNARGK